MPTIFKSKKKSEELKKSALSSKQTSKNTRNEDQEEKEIRETIKKPPKGKKKCQLKGHTHNPFAAYNYYPDHAHFINEDPEEHVVLLLRKHPITNFRWIAIALLMIVAPSFAFLFPFFSGLPGQFQVIGYIVWYLITTAYIFEQFLSWYFQVNIITDERVLEVDFVNLIYREMTAANIDQIQDVTVEVGGATRTFLNYGNVVIQTAGEVPRINFEAVPKPDKVQRVLRELDIQEQREKLEGRIR